MILNATTESIMAVLGGAAAPAPEFTVSYEDTDLVSGQKSYGNKETAADGATDVTILAAPGANVVRRLLHLSLYNKDDASITATIKRDVSAVQTSVGVFTLATLETLWYSPESGWQVLSTAGALARETDAGA